MSKRAAIKKKISERREKAVTLFNRICRGEVALSGAWHRAVVAGRVFVVSSRKFVRDDCPTRASSITYTIILSLVPMLAVALTIYSVYYGVGRDRRELFNQILILLSEYNITMNIEPIFNTILGLVENAGKIGGISAAVMIFSATALFRSLEKSLNHIWNVKKGRTFLQKIVYYWAALTLGPVILGAGLYVATRLSTALTSITFVHSVIKFLAPFSIIWLLFLLAYVALPNARVPFRPAAVGASFTSAVWVLFILGFIVYVRSFAGSTFVIYGALAAVPIFLLMVYASSLILLFGAEVAFTLMHPESYRSLKQSGGGVGDLTVFEAISLLSHIYGKFEHSGGPSTTRELRRDAPARWQEIDRYLELFQEVGLISRDNDAGCLPATSSENVSLNRVIDAVMRAGMGIPAGADATRLGAFMAGLFERIAAGRKRAVGRLTLKDVIDKK